MDKLETQSTAIRAVGYSRVLEIAFQSGRVYQYFDVDEAVYKAFMDSNSKGQYFNAHIRGKYPCQEVAMLQRKTRQPKLPDLVV
jgi:hypothetical protein